jgi:diguanylate cyclase
MSEFTDPHDGTMVLATAALAGITARGQAADPKSFELWYNFAAGHSGLLQAAVNGRLDHNGTLGSKDVDEIYSAHISRTDGCSKVDNFGARLADEIEQVMAMLVAAGGSASSCSAELGDASQRLRAVSDSEGVRAVVEGLVLATKEMEASNHKLHDQLHALWDEVDQLRQEIKAARAESLIDPLTSLGNRRFFNMTLDQLVTDCQAKNEPLALLFADVDHFKAINDTYGHIVGDRILRFVASTLKENVKGKDIAARFGGEEFAVILPETSLRDGVQVAEQLRRAVTKCKLVRRSTGEKQTQLTISIGVAALHNGTTPQALVEVADTCLYAAKRSGRNCVIDETDEKMLTAVAGPPTKDSTRMP